MSPKRILVIDDEPDVVMTLAMRLKVNGYEIISAADGEEGLEKAKSGNPDLIICDWVLPKLDGCEVCKRLKQDPAYSKIPIILCTAKAEEKDKDLAKESGAEAYVTKPYDAKNLLSIMRDLIEKSAS